MRWLGSVCRPLRGEGAPCVRLVLALFLALAPALWGAASPVCAAEDKKVVFAPLSGSVGVQMEQFIGRVIRQAEGERAALVVFELDTRRQIGRASCRERV